MTEAQKLRNYLKTTRRYMWLTFPVTTGETVQEGHAKWCADYGHAKWYRLNEFGRQVLVPQCPNCGDDVWDENGNYTRVSLVKV